MENFRVLPLALGASLLGMAAISDGADTCQRRSPYSAATVSLHTEALQPVANSFAFGVNRSSFRDRRLVVVGDLVNLSAVTYGKVRLLVTTQGGGRRRVSVARIAPGRSRRVLVRLDTPHRRRPGTIHIAFTRAVADYEPMPPRRPAGP